MIRNDLSYEEALALPDPKQIWLNGSQIIVEDSPITEVPLSVEGWQARLALHDAGLLEGIDAYIANENGELSIRWNWSGKVYRNSPHVLAVADAFELSSEDLDNLFIAAAGKS